MSYLHYWGWDGRVIVLYILHVMFMCTFSYPEWFHCDYLFFLFFKQTLVILHKGGRESLPQGHRTSTPSSPVDNNGRLVWTSVLLFLLPFRRMNLTEFVILRVLWVWVEEGSQLGWVVGHDASRSRFEGTAEIFFWVHDPEVGLEGKTRGRDSGVRHFDNWSSIKSIVA